MDQQQVRHRFSWLQFSDLLSSPGGNESLFVELARGQDVLKRVHDDVGPFHAILLTGDLANAGKPDEYVRVSDALNSLLQLLHSLGSEPVVLSVPGNHDANWTRSTEQLLLRLWFDEPELRDSFWVPGSTLMQAVLDSFSNYRSWENRHRSLRPTKYSEGVISGDFAATIELPHCRVGIVGLNSAFLQISDGNFLGRLALDERQISAVCEGNATTWASRHDFCLIMTHHPPSWLSAESNTTFRTQIAPRGRFLAQLCGSLHEPRRRVLYEGSSSDHTPLLILSPPATFRRGVDAGYIAGTISVDPKAPYIRIVPRYYSVESQTWIQELEPGESLDFRLPLEVQRTRNKRLASTALASRSSDQSTYSIDRVEIENFRCFDFLAFDLNRPSMLSGHWTCLAGINGAGKSSILQAICLALMGEPAIRELGGNRLNRNRRLDSGKSKAANVRLFLRGPGGPSSVLLRLDDDLRSSRDSSAEGQSMLLLWQRLSSQVLASYGATRTIVEHREERDAHLSAHVRHQMTLFDPHAQIVAADVLVRGRQTPDVLFVLLKDVVRRVFDRDLLITAKNGRLRFVTEREPLESVDLPDGYRSTIAWIADLCSAWCMKRPELARSGDPADLEGIVLVDEIDLHLHSSVQRGIIPRLRQVFPKVQWIISTHSPLVLANFDRSEIVALDRREPGGVRVLDRQILGFSSDEIYNWLMSTPPTGVAMEEELRGRVHSEESQRELAELLEMSPAVNEAEARERVRKLVARLENLKR